MRTLVVVLIILCVTGCNKTAQQPKRAPLQLPKLNSQHPVNLAAIQRPPRSTDAQKLAMMKEIWHGTPFYPHSEPASMTSWDINISNGDIVLFDGTYFSDAYLYFGLPDDVYFLGPQSFADLAMNPPNGPLPNVQIETNGSPTKPLLVDCTIGGWNPTASPTFQFSQSSQYGQWTNTSTVTPSGGHVFYGISPIPFDQFGIQTWTWIRLQPSPGSPGVLWQFFHCELTFVP
jgi:hypothetical protein